ncbi:valine--pyruvate transaminase [Cellvibrio sp. QJXJ]|uniref:valine--pyruvate transaminase n=1 Tax=Cellvibrio sp. QJXJ TaxID=2964606 RepID=UPI0021C31220|nr:valine--pyruvate transaminase [Cellvibrio sp. QJXJ]UUA74068.1 valine--pyruvate transaminase [Cellvibrio sp. QJXJ]
MSVSSLKLSRFGQKLCTDAGIVTLMDDLGEALRVNPEMIFMGGGNPARIPSMEQAFASALDATLANPRDAHELLGLYQPPQGDAQLLDAIADLLNHEYGWAIARDNIALSNGSQAAFFVLFNLFAGDYADGSNKKIQLPLTPEYLGYSDLGISEDFFTATRPSIELLDDGFFKYHVDFDELKITSETGALCVSRPTNPTGNVISDEELTKLDALAHAHQVPFIVDGAYGTPFPNILFVDAQPHWNSNTILVLSLSKLGLPGARTGIVIADPAIIQAFAKANTILSLATGNFGPAVARHLLRDGKILRLSREVVAPFYRTRMEMAVARFKSALGDLPCLIHKPEGAIFLWLWFKDLPISSELLYQRLKARGVLVVSGHHFFPGLAEDWPHRHECIRVTYCQEPETVARGAAIIADEVRRVYREAG